MELWGYRVFSFLFALFFVLFFRELELFPRSRSLCTLDRPLFTARCFVHPAKFLPLLCLSARETLPSHVLLAGLGLGHGPEARHETDTGGSGIIVAGPPRVCQDAKRCQTSLSQTVNLLLSSTAGPYSMFG